MPDSNNKPSVADKIKRVVRTDHTGQSPADQPLFAPTPQLRKIKAEFWSKYEAAGALDLQVHFGPDVDRNGLPEPLRAVPVKYLSNPGFLEWFNNRDEFKQRLEYLSHLALDTAEEILRNDEAPPAARVQMAKLVLEASGKTKSSEKMLDQKIAEMTKEELEKYIASQVQLIPTP